MKKSSMGNIAIAITWINIALVVITIFYFASCNYKEISIEMYSIMSTYIKFSFIPAACSFILSILVLKRVERINAIVNILYLVLYLTVFFIVGYVTNGI